MNNSKLVLIIDLALPFIGLIVSQLVSGDVFPRGLGILVGVISALIFTGTTWLWQQRAQVLNIAYEEEDTPHDLN